MSLINRAFLNQIINEGELQIDIKRTLPLKVRGLKTKEHNAYKYVIILMYIPGRDSDKVTLIRREIYIVDDLSAKALIGINIMKFKDIVLDIDKNLAIIGSYNSL